MKNIINFLFETGQLKRVKRSGWWVAGIKDPESVAEHSFRAAIVGYVLAKLEGANAKKVALMCLFHDLQEARINDLHKVAQRYIDSKSAETKALNEQREMLPDKVGNEITQLHIEIQEQKTKEAIVARDADLIECILQAREYIDIGYSYADDWIKNGKRLLRTDSAKKMGDEIENTSSNEWWEGLKKIAR